MIFTALPNEQPAAAVKRLAPVYGLNGDDLVAMSEAVGIDPITILAVVSAILPILMDCIKTPDEATEYFRRDTIMTRRRIRKACNRVWQDKHKQDAPRELVRAVQNRLAATTLETMTAIYNAA